MVLAAKCPNLSHLEWHGELSPAHAAVLGGVLSSSQRLTRLELRSISPGQQADMLGQALRDGGARLTQLLLNTPSTDDQALAAGLGTLTNLRHLELSSGGVGDVDDDDVDDDGLSLHTAQALSALTCLTHLRVNGPAGGEGALQLCRSLAGMPHLQTLELYGWRANDQVGMACCASLASLEGRGVSGGSMAARECVLSSCCCRKGSRRAGMEGGGKGASRCVGCKALAWPAARNKTCHTIWGAVADLQHTLCLPLSAVAGRPSIGPGIWQRL